MRHLSILMWKKEHYNQNTFNFLEISKFTIFNQKIYFNSFWKNDFFKKPSGFRFYELKIRS